IVLRYRQELSLAEHPSGGGEVASENADLANVWLCHVFSSLLLSLARENALQRDTEAQHQEWLHVQVRLAAAHIGNRRGVHRHLVVVVSVVQLRGSAGELIIGSDDEIAVG